MTELKALVARVASGHGRNFVGGSCRVVPVLESEDAVGEGCQVGEVVGADGLALQDGVVDLIEPRRVDRGVHHDRVGNCSAIPSMALCPG